ncbi:hypothetical protein QL992_08775 [Microbacterium sp. APC 3898]|uniref:Yip1 domain-containing protein n=1 Tax=Planococcus notacanthi TaxID=3035188 RepID=A0ABT7ZKT1_9BACL|nr:MULTISPECIES: hypothetical protein [Terrabacteria group]MBF6634427.1 YIP1 family protein [Planococcus sp. (in: firmicutes)]MDN3427754.1 hypothetical protein [Planococcus sp. APC 4016]MDN3499306.1 hypothetical protein [Microbacterium sp. APC 3898]
MKERVSKMVGKMVALNDSSFRSFLELPKTQWVSNLLLLIVGIGYGAISIASNASYIASFDSALLQNFIVPAIFILFGLLMAFITKIGLALLLWAGSKGLGGKGLLRDINRAAPVALLPGLLGAPYLAEAGNGHLLVYVLLAIGVVWMYLVCVKIIKTTQSFTAKKAYLAALAAFVFLASVYYLIIPPA